MPPRPRRLALLAVFCSVAVFAGSLRPAAQSARRVPRHTRHRLKPLVHGATGGVRSSAAGDDTDPPEVAVGERLFLETRFAQFFAAHVGSDVNRRLATGDPVLDTLETASGLLRGPFAGKSVNCRSCHFVDDATAMGARVNTYGDYTTRSRVPEREDGETRTPRNSPPLVNATLPRTGFVLHFDGEFPSAESLVRGTLLGRNFGWMPTETATARAHIARVVREDDGTDELARQYAGLPYWVLLQGTDPRIPSDLRLPEAYRADALRSDDDAVLDVVARLVAAYLHSLVFAQGEDGCFDGSPYDAFLAKNGLPCAPDAGEPASAYAKRLKAAVDGLAAPLYVGPGDGSFELQDQPFKFGRDELQGLRVFLTGGDEARSSAGNCVACHTPPVFTDFSFHNTGATQEEYDALHGTGAFASLPLPDLATRNAQPDAYLPPSAAHPAALGIFRRPAARERPGQTDLGLWNVWANPSIPAPQAAIAEALGVSGRSAAEVLPRTAAAFKTPGLRGLGQSAPYFHTGRMASVEQAVQFYALFSQKARLGRVFNAAPEIQGIFLSTADVAPLVAFLEALDEDYQ
ncbi:MAG TPA: hypothetical protein VMT70_00620 [Vicinamibacteria bacterium]|nr:hypothetical protein [Vicinamibacteria bacterium]